MSILSWLLKSKKEMAKPNTKRVRLGKYTVSSHAQNRVVDPKRNLKKSDMTTNLFGKSKNSQNYRYKDGTIQYDRVNEKNRTITHITKKDRIVKSINRYHNTEKSKRQTFQNFKKEK